MADTQMRKQPSPPPIVGTKTARNPAEPSGPPVMLPENTNVTEDARDYLDSQSLWDDFTHAISAAKKSFSDPSLIDVELSCDPSEPDSPSIVFYIQSNLPRIDFNAAISRTRNELRKSNRLYMNLGILRHY